MNKDNDDDENPPMSRMNSKTVVIESYKAGEKESQ